MQQSFFYLIPINGNPKNVVLVVVALTKQKETKADTVQQELVCHIIIRMLFRALELSSRPAWSRRRVDTRAIVLSKV